jgi:pimeloyl-ACP methyl ester carboxylesterase
LTRFVHTSAPVPRVVVGWSLGGHVALEAAATVPQLRGLMLIGAPPTGFPASGFLSMPTASMSRYPLPEHVREHIEGLCRDSSKRMVFEQDFAVTDPRVREDLARCIASGDFADEVDIIRGSLPVAAVMGEHDHLIDLRYLQELPWGNLWEHQVHLVAGAMHAPQCDAPEAVAKLISRFVSHLHHG